MQTSRLDLIDTQSIKQGVSYSLLISLGVNLTGCTFISQLRDAFASSDRLAFTVALASDVTIGDVLLSLTPQQTVSAPTGRYVWDLLVIFPDGRVWAAREGTAIIRATATRLDGTDIPVGAIALAVPPTVMDAMTLARQAQIAPPQLHTLTIKQGATFSFAIALGLDLTGCNFAAQLRDSYFDSDLMLFTVGIDPTDPRQLYLGLSAGSTMALVAGRYVWDLLVAFPSGFIWAACEGIAIVKSTATRIDGLEIIPSLGVFQSMASHLVALNPHPQYVLQSEFTSSTNQSAESDSLCHPGQPLYLKSNGHCDLALATSFRSSNVCGLAISETLPTIAAHYLSDLLIEQADWSNVIGASSLSIGSLYYLSPDSPGKLTTIAPTTPGQFVICVGVATSSQKLSIEIQPSILL